MKKCYGANNQRKCLIYLILCEVVFFLLPLITFFCHKMMKVFVPWRSFFLFRLNFGIYLMLISFLSEEIWNIVLCLLDDICILIVVLKAYIRIGLYTCSIRPFIRLLEYVSMFFPYLWQDRNHNLM